MGKAAQQNRTWMTSYQTQVTRPQGGGELCVIAWVEDVSIALSTAYKHGQPCVTYLQPAGVNLVPAGPPTIMSRADLATTPATEANHVHLAELGDTHTFALAPDLSLTVHLAE